MNLPNQPDPAYASMMGWMQRWTDLENQLALLLLQPFDTPRCLAQIEQTQGLMGQMLALDEDGSLYWLFQLAATSTDTYSASHSMVCAALCRLVGTHMGLDAATLKSLDSAALTMNIAMTGLQNQLANQLEAPTANQRFEIDNHPARGAQWLRELGVKDALWLELVEQHHDISSPAHVATRLLMAVDRYAAMISPRETRPGKRVVDSGRHVLVNASKTTIDEVGHALLQTIGICPPGTFVRLDDGRVAVVLRRTDRPGQPWVGTVLDSLGLPLTEPELINTAAEGCGIEAALVTRTVKVVLDHPRLLQLSRMAVARP